jgi:7-cyano-7-deazaguanine synthase
MEVLTKARPEFGGFIGDVVEDKRAVLLLSGGMDSTTLLYDLLNLGCEVHPISFIYGQKHKKEVGMALASCTKLGLELEVVDIGFFGQLAPSALTRTRIDVPEGHYEDSSMKVTVVPNRNMVLISLATSYALGIGVHKVYYAAHSGDHAIYPDCRPAFLIVLGKALKLCDYDKVSLEAPYMYWNKSDVVKRGLELRVDYSLTWSCYRGEERPCGKCGTCTERAEAFRNAGVRDPLEV